VAIAGNETLIGLDPHGAAGGTYTESRGRLPAADGLPGMFGPGVSARNAALRPGLVIFHVKMPVLDGTRQPRIAAQGIAGGDADRVLPVGGSDQHVLRPVTTWAPGARETPTEAWRAPPARY